MPSRSVSITLSTFPFANCAPIQHLRTAAERSRNHFLISQALTKHVIDVGNTNATRGFTYVTDTVEGFIKIAESDKSVGQK